jgi:aspartate/glutamate racemase
MRKIGLVPGMMPESTTAYYRMIISFGRRLWSDPVHTPIMPISSIDLAEMVAHRKLGDDNKVMDLLPVRAGFTRSSPPSSRRHRSRPFRPLGEARVIDTH